MSSPLENYALIGDCHTAALISREGSIDWLCLPRFDSDACFSALLGDERNGRWQLTVPEGRVVRRRYLRDTLALETEYESADGRARIVDLMPFRENVPRLIRRAEAIDGKPEVALRFEPRFGFGKKPPRFEIRDNRIWAECAEEKLCLESSAPLTLRDGCADARFAMQPERPATFSCTWHRTAERNRPAPVSDETLRQTLRTWREWAALCRYQGVYREALVRSLITLKALTYAPTGGIVAAPTTSLPEKIGGELNWDYRFCWLRDAGFTLSALLASGYREEAAAWRDWLLHCVGGNPSPLQIVYGIGGESSLPETCVDWLAGYEGSRPVRRGNAAHRQFQLDAFGEVIDVLSMARQAGLPAEERMIELRDHLVEHVERVWREPDNGIWEVRGNRKAFTYSKVMAWAALDRAIGDADRYHLPCPRQRWARLRQQIRDDILCHGFHAGIGAFVQAYGEDRLDASLLRLPLVGFLPASDPRMLGTVAAIERHLCRDGLVRRYLPERELTGSDSDEGVFLACSFWLADNYALSGRKTEARALLERLLALRNDVGLLAEEYDVERQRLIGNFPQALSHIALVNCIHNIDGDTSARHLSIRRSA